MKSSHIKADLEDLGLTQKDIAKELRCTHVAVSNCINRKNRSKRIAEHVSKKIGKTLEEVFPEYLESAA